MLSPVKLPGTNLHLSPLIMGTMRLGAWGANLSTKAWEKFVEDCLELGITTFDHADIYGHYTTESDFGKALKHNPSLRNKVQIITKCGINLTTPNRPKFNIKSYDTSKEQILWSADNSLQQLNVEQIDLLLIHRPSPLMDPDEIAEAFTQLKTAGKVKAFGVSNFTPSQFDLLHSRFPLATNQIEASITHLDPFFDGTLDQCLEKRICPMAWSPLGGGSLFTKTTTDERAIRIQRTASKLAEKHHSSGVDQILLAWLRQHPSRILPILGTTKISRVSDAVQSMSIQLTREEWFELLEASRGEEVA